jgi:protocatechuate 3,4-dioxygenase, beta subunit
MPIDVRQGDPLAAAGPLVPGYRRDDADVHPPLLHPPYKSTVPRSPSNALTVVPQTLTEITGPLLGEGRVGELDHDLTRQHAGEPLGERIIVHGRVLDGDGRPVRNTLVEVWQANSAGRYAHAADEHPAPHDPNFTGVGRCLTDDQGRYEFITVKPGAYPWKNHTNAWRPAHVHFSLFGPAFATRLITQMYFPGAPLFYQDPIFNSIPDERARAALVSRFDLDRTVPEWALAYHFDIVLRGRDATPTEDPHQDD